MLMEFLPRLRILILFLLQLHISSNHLRSSNHFQIILKSFSNLFQIFFLQRLQRRSLSVSLHTKLELASGHAIGHVFIHIMRFEALSEKLRVESRGRAVGGQLRGKEC